MYEVKMPALGMTMQEGAIAKWLKQEGDPVEAGEPLLEVTTDKLTMEVESPASGVLRKIVSPEGDVVPVTGTIAFIGSPDEPLTETPVGGAPVAGGGTPVAEREAESGGVRASPAARRLAKELGVSLDCLSGTGPGGRVKAADVIAASGRTSPGSGAATGRPVDRMPGDATGETETVPLTAMRATIAQRMAESAHTTAPFSVGVEVDASGIARLRAETKRILDSRGVGLSYTTVIVKACAIALKEFPALNASFGESGIEVHSRINVGVAVAVDDGLVVPVIRDVDQKSLSDLAVEMDRLVRATRDRRVAPGQTEGGTFTVSNLGMTGVESFVPIIRLPECCILGVGAVVNKPVALESGSVGVKPVMRMNLTVDHRVTDGWQAARFLMRIKQALEEPASLLL